MIRVARRWRIWGRCCLGLKANSSSRRIGISIWIQAWEKVWRRNYPYHKRKFQNLLILTIQKTLMTFLNPETAIWVLVKHTSMTTHRLDKLEHRKNLNKSSRPSHRNKHTVTSSNSTKERKAKQIWNQCYHRHCCQVIKVMQAVRTRAMIIAQPRNMLVVSEMQTIKTILMMMIILPLRICRRVVQAIMCIMINKLIKLMIPLDQWLGRIRNTMYLLLRIACISIIKGKSISNQCL